MEEEELTYLSAATLGMDCEPPVEPELPNGDVSMVDSLVTTCQPVSGTGSPVQPPTAEDAVQAQTGEPVCSGRR